MIHRSGMWAVFAVLAGSTAFGIGDDWKTEARWLAGKPAGEAAVGGYWMNLGPTGIRARLHELSFEVKYVFPDSPAAGHVQPGDVIVGVNERPFRTPHTFGFDWDKAAKKGYEGPMMDFGNAIEESEGKDGILTLSIKRGGKPSSVKVRIRTLGKFSDTYPYKCKKTDLLYQEICDYLEKNSGDWGPMFGAVGGLTLLASGNPRYLKLLERTAKNMGGMNPLERGGLNNWNLTYIGIYLGEYYLATGDASVLRTMYDVHKGLEFAQTYPGVLQHQKDWGGYPELGIMEGLAITAYAMLDKCKVEFPPQTYELMKKRVRYITRKDGCVLYARDPYNPGWEQEPMKLEGAGGAYECAGRAGAAMLGFYLISNEDPQAMPYVANVGTFQTRYLQYFPDTHACPGIGMHLMGLGLAAGHPAGFRQLMDYHKAYLNLMRTHEPGKFVALPSRSDACDLRFAPAFTSANIGLLLAVKEKRLQIGGGGLKPGRRGAKVAKPVPTTAAPAPSVEPEARPRKSASADTISAWDVKLRARIQEELAAGRKPKFKWTALGSEAEVRALSPADELRVEGKDGGANLSWSAIPLADRRNLALSMIRKGTAKDHALAAFYHLALGEEDKAQPHLDQAGAGADAVKAAFR